MDGTTRAGGWPIDARRETTRRARRAGVAMCLLLAAGCGPRDRVALTSDEDNLDSLALRGDSVVAMAQRGFTAADSAAAVAIGAQRVRDALREGAAARDDTAPTTTSAGRLAEGERSPREVVVGTTAALPPRGPAVDPPRPVPSAPAPSGPRAGGDTLRGLVAVVGSAPLTQVVVTPAGGAQVVLNGMPAAELGALGGAEVVVRGVRTSPRELVVADYAVRRVDGVDATDGMLIATGDGLVLQARDGSRRAVRNPPPALQALVGTRVWIAGSLDRPVAFGAIRRLR